MDSSIFQNRDSIVKVITSPLGFFALSLLILEGFLSIVVVGSGSSLTPDAKQLGMWMATSSFAGIVIIVSLMVWLIPKNLTFKSEDWMEEAKDQRAWGTKSKPVVYKELSNDQSDKPTTSP